MTPISDDDRRQASAELEKMVGAGKVTLGEFSELSTKIWAAQTHAELNAAVAVARSNEVAARQQAAQPQPAIVEANTGKLQAWFGDLTRKGRWDITEGVDAFAFLGEVMLDLREAVIDSVATDVKVQTICGDVRVLVPPGVRVEVSGNRIMGDLKLDDGNFAAPYGPLIRLKADTFMGTVKVRTLPPGEKIPTMWKWF